MSAPRQLTPRDVLAYSITAPDLSGRFIVHNGYVVIFEDAVKFLGGWHLWRVLLHCRLRGWIFEQIKVPVN